MKARKVAGLDPGGTLRDNAARIVETRMGELSELAPKALEPGEEAAQHDMRIAAKRLRYVLDLTAGCLGAGAVELRGTAKELQSVLGEIHDCDVMLPLVAGVGSVEVRLRARRELLHARFRELWSAAQAGERLAL